MATLRVKTGPLAGQTIELESDLTIGRQNADLTIDDAELSRRHAVFRLLADGLEVEDLGSSNGTFVDGRRIDAPTLVGGGAQLKCGVTVFEVEGVLRPRTTRVAVPDDVTEAWTAPRDATIARALPPEMTQARPEPAPPPAGRPAAVAEVPSGEGPVGEFHPPARKRRARLASRSWVPVALSFGTVILVAIALLIYFAAR
jgi:hypothetical protein